MRVNYFQNRSLLKKGDTFINGIEYSSFVALYKSGVLAIPHHARLAHATHVGGQPHLLNIETDSLASALMADEWTIPFCRPRVAPIVHLQHLRDRERNVRPSICQRDRRFIHPRRTLKVSSIRASLALRAFRSRIHLTLSREQKQYHLPPSLKF